MSDMRESRTAGYVVLTSMAAGLEILRNGWSEIRTDPATEAAADDDRDTDAAPATCG